MLLPHFKTLSFLNVLVAGVLLSGCSASAPPGPTPDVGQPDRVFIEANQAWGGEARCSAARGCLLAFVEHEGGQVALYRLLGRKAELLDKAPVDYHPDSAKWLDDNLLAAAVEGTQSIEIFDTTGDKFKLLLQVPVGFAPRDVLVATRGEKGYTLLASPYSGTEVTWFDLSADGRSATNVRREPWCLTARSPQWLPSAPGGGGVGLAAGCDRDLTVVYKPLKPSEAQVTTVAKFKSVPRNLAASPSGKWWYVVQELGGNNARISTEDGTIQWLPVPKWGAYGVAPVADDFVVWGEDRRAFLQKYAADGQVLETRVLKTSGFSSGLQIIDLDADTHPDLVVLNAAGEGVDVLYGPLWDKAQPIQLPTQVKP